MCGVSVIIPAFNASSYICESIRSACDQTYNDIEVLVVDDGSADDTADLVLAMAKHDERIRLIRTGRRGVSAARNLGIALARSSLIATLDADDVWHPDKIQRQIEIFRDSSPNVGVVYCWAAGIDGKGRVILPVWNDSRAEGDVLFEIVQSGILSNGSTPLMTRDAIERAGGYDETLHLCEDWQFYTAMAGVCQFRVVAECLTGYRLVGASCSTDIFGMERAINKVTDWILSKWPDIPDRVLKDRATNVSRYLSFLAIRRGQYGLALSYLWRAIGAQPQLIVNFKFIEMYALLLGHALGLRQYRWQFWRVPRSFIQK